MTYQPVSPSGSTDSRETDGTVNLYNRISDARTGLVRDSRAAGHDPTNRT